MTPGECILLAICAVLIFVFGKWNDEKHGGGEMLVLSRKRNETIRIGDDITITVVRIGPNSVRIGIEAPPEVKVVRDDALKLMVSQKA